MAVQQNKKSRSARDMRRSHDALTASTLSVEKTTGEIQIGRASCRERVYISVVAGAIKKKKTEMNNL